MEKWKISAKMGDEKIAAVRPRNEEKRDMLKSNKKAEPLAAKTAAEPKTAAPKAEKVTAAPKAAEPKAEKTTAAAAAKAEKAAAAAKAKAEKAAAAAAAKAEKAAAAAAAKAEKAAAAAKAKAEKAPVVRKRAAKKAEVKLYVQYQGVERSQEEIVEAVKAAWTGAAIETLELYVKPEDGAVYYVINGTESGKVDF